MERKNPFLKTLTGFWNHWYIGFFSSIFGRHTMLGLLSRRMHSLLIMVSNIIIFGGDSNIFSILYQASNMELLSNTSS